MEKLNPVYTLDNKCQDCYRCVRVCPVKAIRFREGRAQVLRSRCIACARCVAACPSRVKLVRSDLERVKRLIADGGRVYASLAGSWRGPFDISKRRMAALLKKLGFCAVSEAALGAQEVAAEYARILNSAPNGLYISSFCPSLVDYVRLYKPAFAPRILPVASAPLTHARMLKDRYGEDIHVVFIGPCVARKNESDRNPGLIDAALTFDELRRWIAQEHVGLPDDGEIDADSVFVPETACEGALYPLEGGTIEAIRRVGLKPEVQTLSLSSLQMFISALKHFDMKDLRHPVFVEAFACVGGCIAGPGISTKKSIFSIASRIREKTPYRANVPTLPAVTVPASYPPNPVAPDRWTPDDIAGALKKIGKYAPEDELNCMGCGYSTCREMAVALLNGDAEPAMCASYMRALAVRRAATVLKGMPSSVVMFDRDMNIIEANDSFVETFVSKGSGASVAQLREKLIGTPVASILDWTDLFHGVMRSGEEIYREHYAYRGKYYEVRVFPLEQGESAGAIIYDVASTRVSSEKAAQKAREVIRRNIAIVQEIACLLGEHMVETEALLSSIADNSDEPPAPNGRG